MLAVRGALNWALEDTAFKIRVGLLTLFAAAGFGTVLGHIHGLVFGGPLDYALWTAFMVPCVLALAAMLYVVLLLLRPGWQAREELQQSVLVMIEGVLLGIGAASFLFLWAGG